MKRVLSMLLVLVLICSVVICTPVSASAESLYIRKVVSVVYDDSGSMKGAKWAYANYAMQAFCGMLNSDDQLFITYMSHSQWGANYVPEKIDLSVGEIQGSVDSIRTHTDSGSTPYTAVEIAYNKLKSVNDSNPNTQYWLVVITDGEFNEHDSMSDSEKKNVLNRDFEKYAEGIMPNGTNPQITFLGIGGVVSPDENPNKDIYTYSASDAEGIIDAMSEMADRISGRTRLQKNSLKKIDDNTIQVSSSIPLLNIAVFAQGSNAAVIEAVHDNETSIPISRQVSLRYQNYSDLVGGAFLLGDSQNVIGSGTYNITFDQKVDLDDVVILFEPALEARISISLNGKTVSDYSELDAAMEGDKISVSCKIYEMGTDVEIAPSLMPPATQFEIYVSEEGTVAEQVSGKEMLLSDYILKHIETEITAAVLIDGFNPIDCSVKFTPTEYIPKVVYAIRFDHPELFWYKTLAVRGNEVILFYGASAEESAVLQRRIDEVVPRYLEGIDDSMSAYDVALRVHVKVISSVDYDTIALSKQEKEGGPAEDEIDYLRTICGVFLDGKAVCEGYARAVQYLLQKCGVECAEAAGFIRKETGEQDGGHAWNILKIDGEYYYLDTTWDDSSNTVQTVKSTDPGFGYFCITTDEILRTRDTALCPADVPNCIATRGNYYYHNDFVLDTYDLDKIKVIAQTAAKNQSKSFTLKCKTKALYDQALSQLCAVGQDCYEVLKVASKANKKILTNTYSYSWDKNIWTITVKFKFK